MYTFINRFTVSGDAQLFEKSLGEISAFMAEQPGFRSYRLYHSDADPAVYVENAVWEDAGSHRTAVSSDGFRSRVGQVMQLAAAEPAPFSLVSEVVRPG